jgi:hypothetical protein
MPSPSHPVQPGILRHSVNLRTSPGYIAEGAYREELLDLARMMTSPAQKCRSMTMCYFRSEVGNVPSHTARALSTTNNSCLSARLCLFVRVNNASDWQPAREAVDRIVGAVSSGEKLATDRNRRVFGMSQS